MGGRNIPSPGSRWACLTCLSWFIKTWKHIERIVKILPRCMCLFVQNNLMFSFLLCVCTYCTWLLLVIDGYNHFPLRWIPPRYHNHFMFEAGQVYPAEPAGLKHHLVHGMSVDGQNIKQWFWSPFNILLVWICFDLVFEHAEVCHTLSIKRVYFPFGKYTPP